MNELTNDWLETFRGCKQRGEDLASSIFWRLALDVLPEGVDGQHPDVQAALAEIKAAVAEMCKASVGREK